MSFNIAIIIIFVAMAISALVIFKPFNRKAKEKNGINDIKEMVWIYTCTGDMVPTPVIEVYGKFFSRFNAEYISCRFELIPSGKTSQSENIFRHVKKWEPITSGKLKDFYDSAECGESDDRSK